MINSERKFERMIEGLLDEIGGHPIDMLKSGIQLKKCIEKPAPESRNAPTNLQDSINNLRICVKYLMFDLDATRRENVYYKKLLEDKEI